VGRAVSDPMTQTNQCSGEVPLAVWQLAADGSDASLRRRLAGRLVEGYLPDGGAVLDLVPGTGDLGHAVLDAGRAAVVMADPGAGVGVRGFDGTFDLAVALPPDADLAGGLYSPPEDALTRAAAALRPGGLLVSCLVGTEGGDPIGRAVSAADGLGLRYIQHVVALLSDGLPEQCSTGERRVAHADVLVFSKGRA